MKTTKNSIIRITKYDLISLLCDRIIYHRDGGETQEEEHWSEILEALKSDSLDIDGYTRGLQMVWTKFDPENPKTHPDEEQKILWSENKLPPRDVIYCYALGWAWTADIKLRAKTKEPLDIYWTPIPKVVA